MNCKEFSNLLEDYLDGMLSDEEASCLREHAEKCASCAAHLALCMDCRKMDENIVVPDEFSSGWRQMIREEQNMEKTAQKKKNWKTWLASAAAVVFVLGGTLLTRDQMNLNDTDEGNHTTYTLGMYDSERSTQTSMKRSAAPAANYAMSDVAAYGAEEAAEAAAEKIIRTASFTLKTLEYDQDLENIQKMTGEAGGRVEYLSVNGDKESGALRSAYLTLRIPSAKLDEFIAGAQGVGRLTALTQESQDVSANYYDAQARLSTQVQKMERLQKLMDAAEKVSDLIEIETAIADTQYWIDHYTGQLNHYDDQVDYSTVSVSLQEIRISEAKEITLWQRMVSGLKESLEDGVAFLGDLTVFLVAAAPWLLVVGIVFFAAKKIRKKRKEK